MPEAGDPVSAHVASDHAVRQARLKRLVDDAAAPAEIGLATVHEAGKRHQLRHTATLRMQHAHHARIGAPTRNNLNLPHALPAIATVLFQYPRTLLYSRWKGIMKFLGAPVQVRVGAPAEMFGAPQ